MPYGLLSVHESKPEDMVINQEECRKMNIIIAGCGKLGFTLAEQLCEENHDVVVIDKNQYILDEVSEMLDVQVLRGNCTIYHVLKEAGVEQCDLVIASTGQDEVNLLTCLIAKQASDCGTIARVRNPEYVNEIPFLKNELGLAMTINPERAAAAEILKLIQIPSASEIDSFAKGKVNVVRVQVLPNSPLDHLTLLDFHSKICQNALVCVVKREKETVIPKGDFHLQANDIIYVALSISSMNEFFKRSGLKYKQIKDVMIAGGGTIAYYLAKQLAEARISVKIIEQDEERCKQLSELLPSAIIIHGDASDRQLLLEEGIEHTDAFVTLTGFDEENIILSLYARKQQGVKCITKINKIAFNDVISELEVGSIVCPKYITAEYIIRHVRSAQNTKGSNVETLYRMLDNKVESMEFSIKENSKVTGVPLMKLDLKPNLLIAGIIRNTALIIPTGKDSIQTGDTVIIVTVNRGLKDITDILK